MRLMAGLTVGSQIEFFADTDDPNVGRANNVAPSSGMVIQDAFGTWKPMDEFKLDGGEMLIPFTHNSVQGATTLYGLDYFASYSTKNGKQTLSEWSYKTKKLLRRVSGPGLPVAERAHPRAGEIGMRRWRGRGRGLGTRDRRDERGGRRDREQMADHACSSLPSGVTILMTTPIFAPRRPGWNVTVMTSPAFTMRLVQPLFLILGGEPSSSSSSVVAPPLGDTPSSTCGLVHTYSVTVALIVVSLPMS